MFRKVLIANRGEIALRVISACKEMGIRTVAVYSEADRNSLHVRFADEAICIGPPRSAQSYLNIPAVHLGCRDRRCRRHPPRLRPAERERALRRGVPRVEHQVIGPRPEVTRMMGEKSTARQTMKAAKVSASCQDRDGVIADENEALEWAKTVGYPVILKAVAGGGGRGMRIVRSPDELPSMFNQASNEAAAAFGNGDMYMEKFIERPRHIEFQVLADEHGNVMSLGERECSIQRRHQKLIEEAPSLQITPKLRAELGKTIERSLKDIGYWNAGTIEFLMDEDGKIYFIEMNTRIQVEHCVTEMVTGRRPGEGATADCVGREAAATLFRRFRRAGCRSAGMPSSAGSMRSIRRNLRRAAGRITAFNLPGGNGVRVDTAQYAEGRGASVL